MRHEIGLWKYMNREDLGPLSVLNNGIRNLESNHYNIVPDFRNCPTISIASDYSGTHSAAEFEVLSFLFYDKQSLREWNKARLLLRQEYHIGDREIAYKKLNDIIKRRALLPFLNIANNISGLSVNIAIHKKVASLFAQKLLSPSELGWEKYNYWDSLAFEKMCRAVNLIGFFLAGITHSAQHILWITDEDDIVANETYKADTTEMFYSALQHYSKGYLGSFSCETTALDDSSMELRDLAAIPDLVAGASCEILSQLHITKSIPNDEQLVPLPDSIPDKSNEIINWYADYSHPLKRLLYVIPPRSTPWKTHLMDFQRLS